MKKLMYVLLAALTLSFVACNNQPVTPPEPEEPEIDDPTIPSTMQLFVDGIGEITKDKTITLHNALLSLSGELKMEIKGTIEGVDKIRVMVTRSTTDREDELCAFGTCATGNGETEQEFNFSVIDGSNTWFAHYTVPEADHSPYTVKYKFINYSRVITLTVVYDYQETE